MGKMEDRMNLLIDILRVRSYVSIKELSKLLCVSEMTVRRDIKHLEANSIAENVDGTIVYNPAHLGVLNEQDYNLQTACEKLNHQKEAIGKYAANMVETGDTLIIDTGSTTVCLVPHLPLSKDLTVLCYNINILMELRRNPGVKMIFAGGFYHPNTQMFTCDEGIRFIQGIRAQKVFVSAAGVHESLGITCANNYEVPAKKAILQSSLHKILVADSSKFGQVRSSYFCELDVIHDVVTDDGLSSEWQTRLTDMGITVHLVPSST